MKQTLKTLKWLTFCRKGKWSINIHTVCSCIFCTWSKSWHGRLIKIRYSLSIKICSGQCSYADDNLHVPNHHSIDYHQTLGGHTEILGLSRRQSLRKSTLVLPSFIVQFHCTLEEIHFSNWRLCALLHWKLPENSSISSQNTPHTYTYVYIANMHK